MPVSEAKKRANAKWNASKDNIMVRTEVEEGAAIRAAAAASGQSITQFLLDAARERINREAGFSADSSVAIDLPVITAHVEKTGESVNEFLVRAVADTIARDNSMLSMGLAPVKR